MSARILALFCAVLLVGIAAVAYMLMRNSDTSLSTERTNIEQFFKGSDAKRAYEDFKAAYASSETSAAHTAAHTFGEHLFEREGIAGFPVCDSAFGFGCFHSFIGVSIAEHGEGVIAEFDDQCIRAYGLQGLGCTHGIGHGVLAYYGYTDEALSGALEACRELAWQHSYSGCRDGVFMEYNFRTMQGDDGERRVYSTESRHAPCDAVPLDAAVACYFSQPTWWSGWIDESESDTLLSFCREVATVPEREACVRGIGYAHAPQGSFHAHSGIAYCDSLGGSSRERVLCREGYAWALFADPVFRDGAELVCSQDLNSSESAMCERELLFAIEEV